MARNQPDQSRQLDRDKLPVMGRIWGPEAVAKHQSTAQYGNISAISESPKKEGLIYAGTDDGLIQVTEDGGKTWNKVDKITGVPENGYVHRIFASQHDANTAYAIVNNHQNADFAPYIVKSTDAGKTWALILILLAATAIAQTPRLDDLIARDIASLVETYKMLHAAPELSGHEEKTAAFVAKELRALGFTVTERIGKYARQDLSPYGIVAVMKNGEGPVVLVRADMDGLPVEENTGLPYASKVRAKNETGLEVGVMHACGHDVHVASLLGTAKMLVQLKDSWRGTLLLIGQPAEEIVMGARAMLDDGLYTRFPKPDYILALHAGAYPAGFIGYGAGYFLASADTVDITIRGIGGHGSRPEATKDPIVIAAQVILALQTIISRENAPQDPAVVSVGSIHGGTKHNIIPDEVRLQLTVRTYKEEVRKRILAAIERITKGVALTAGVPAELVSRIPPTAVGGWFKSGLHKTASLFLESPQRQLGDCSGPTFVASLIRRSSTQAIACHQLSTCRRGLQ
ncbi:MAG: amidohydrolase [Blastocatellia bacterium]